MTSDDVSSISSASFAMDTQENRWLDAQFMQDFPLRPEIRTPVALSSW